MIDYYVYRLNVNDKDAQSHLGFIDDPMAFAKLFKPGTMEFTGVKVVAEDLESAKHVFRHPTSDKGDYIPVDEPVVTKAMKGLTTIQSAAISQALKVGVQKLHDVNTALHALLCVVSKLVYMQSDKTISPEKIYRELTKKWTEQFLALEYIDKDGNSGSIG